MKWDNRKLLSDCKYCKWIWLSNLHWFPFPIQIVQPTIHHKNWPSELKKMVVQSTRWPDTSYVDSQQTNDPSINTKRFSSGVARNRRAGAHPVKENDSLDLIRRIDNYCGGVCFAAEELTHCYLLVVGTRAENFRVDQNGGFYRSSLLHPFLSVRIPKRSCLTERTAAFRVSFDFI